MTARARLLACAVLLHLALLAHGAVALCRPNCEWSWLGDGYCDSECNHPACGYDDGDCRSYSYNDSSDSPWDSDGMLYFTLALRYVIIFKFVCSYCYGIYFVFAKVIPHAKSAAGEVLPLPTPSSKECTIKLFAGRRLTFGQKALVAVIEHVLSIPGELTDGAGIPFLTDILQAALPLKLPTQYLTDRFMIENVQVGGRCLELRCSFGEYAREWYKQRTSNIKTLGMYGIKGGKKDFFEWLDSRTSTADGQLSSGFVLSAARSDKAEYGYKSVLFSAIVLPLSILLIVIELASTGKIPPGLYVLPALSLLSLFCLPDAHAMIRRTWLDKVVLDGSKVQLRRVSGYGMLYWVGNLDKRLDESLILSESVAGEA